MAVQRNHKITWLSQYPRAHREHILNFLDCSQLCSLSFSPNKLRHLYWFPVANAGKPPNCISSNCKIYYRIMEPIPNCTFIRISYSVPQQVFHVMVKIKLSHTKKHMTFVKRAFCKKKLRIIKIPFLTWTPNRTLTLNCTSLAELIV